MQLGPGMYSQRTGPCDECGGKGQSIDPAKMCKTCNGKKIKKETKKLNVEVDKGAPNGERYTKHGEGDEIPDAEPGDVIVVIQEKKHKLFKRKGADLFMEKEITLIEALTGLDFILTHLDGRKIRIKNKAGEVIKPDSLFTVENLGMPFHKRTYQHGNLIIQFKIKFPTQIDAKSSTLLQEALGGAGGATPSAKGGAQQQNANKTKQETGQEPEIVLLKQFSEQHRNTDHRGGQGGHDSEEEEEDDGHGHHGGQRVGCQQQ